MLPFAVGYSRFLDDDISHLDYTLDITCYVRLFLEVTIDGSFAGSGLGASLSRHFKATLNKCSE